MAGARRDYYEVLGVGRDADQKAIKDAFRRLALKYHPDRNKEAGAEERFKEIAEAYAVLADPKKRADYDRGGFSGVAGVSPEDLFSGIDFGDIFGGIDFGFGHNGGLFERFFRRRPSGPPRGENLEVELVIPLAKVATGGEEKVVVAHPVACPDCHGSGAKAGTSPRVCADCQGTGRKTVVHRQGKQGPGEVLIQQITICPTCQGRGRIIDTPCPRCGGRGEAFLDEGLTVNIPLGVEEGMALRIPGRGQPSHQTGGTPGDLFVVIRTAPDPRFWREGADLWHIAVVGPGEAAVGAELEIPTLERPATVTLPPGTQPGTVLRLRGKGLPEFGGRNHGDLLLRVEVHIPDRLSGEETSLYGRLRELERSARKR